MVVSFVLLYIPSFMTDPALGSGRQLGRRGRRRARDHRRAVPPRLSAADAGLPPVVRRQRRRQAAETAGHRPAHRPADDPGGGVAGRGQAPRDQGERRRGPRADPVAARVPGERPVHRRPALPAAPPDAVAADAPRRVRGPGPPQRHRREAPGGADRLDDRRRRSDVVDEFKKRNERVKVQVANFPADKFREGLVASDAEVAQALRGPQGHLPDRREAQGPLPDDRPGRPARSAPR